MMPDLMEISMWIRVMLEVYGACAFKNYRYPHETVVQYLIQLSPGMDAVVAEQISCPNVIPL